MKSVASPGPDSADIEDHLACSDAVVAVGGLGAECLRDELGHELSTTASETDLATCVVLRPRHASSWRSTKTPLSNRALARTKETRRAPVIQGDSRESGESQRLKRLHGQKWRGYLGACAERDPARQPDGRLRPRRRRRTGRTAGSWSDRARRRRRRPRRRPRLTDGDTRAWPRGRTFSRLRCTVPTATI
jgi:hypothetical protein